jgi:hypothetical protein
MLSAAPVRARVRAGWSETVTISRCLPYCHEDQAPTHRIEYLRTMRSNPVWFPNQSTCGHWMESLRWNKGLTPRLNGAEHPTARHLTMTPSEGSKSGETN